MAILVLAAALAACRDESSDASAEGASPRGAADTVTVEVEVVDLDAASAPRADRPLIAGEMARVELRVRGGVPPYRIDLRAPESGAALIDASLKTGVGREDAERVTVAGLVALEPTAASGTYQLAALASDQEQRLGRAQSEPFDVIGEGAEVHGDPAEPPFLAIVDAGGRRRTRFYRGEKVSLRGRYPASISKVAVRLLAPGDSRTVLSDTPSWPVKGGVLQMPLSIPRLALPGTYAIEIEAGGARASVPLPVAGPAFPPVTRLTAEKLSLRGGEDGRSPRGSILERGETISIEARVGGGQKDVAAVLRLRDDAGALVSETTLDPTPVATVHPTARLFVGGSWSVPESLSPGRHMLELEVREDDDISTVYREIVVR